jgi:hypothetical protein
MRKTVLLCLLFAVALQLNCQAKKPCTREDAIRAETEASSLQSWSEIHRSFKDFSRCDDGAIAEGYSDSVARLLSDRWTTIGQLNSLIARDRDFEKFTLRHVDELMSPTQARKIQQNATARCPPGAKRLCREIVNKLKETAPGAAPTSR